MRRGPLPDGLDAGFVGHNPPWMGDEDFAAVLFYTRDGDPTIAPGGRTPDGGNTKILWLVRGATGPLTLHGTELGRRTRFTQEVAGASAAGQYPSIVEIPAVGCWRIAAVVGGRRAGSITLPAW